METAKREVFAKEHLQSCLNNIFSQILPFAKETSTFYTATFPREKQKSLVFIFDNGIDPDPKFSGPVLGRLFIDENKYLALCIWPLDEKDKKNFRKELLLKDTVKINFEFLQEKSEENNPSKKTYETANCWPKENKKAPSVIKINLVTLEDNLNFAFFIPFQQNFITYF